MSLATEKTPDDDQAWVQTGFMQDKSISQWNDVKFFPFANLAPIVADLKGVAAVCGMNNIKIVKIDAITEELRPLYEFTDRSHRISEGIPEIFRALAWSIDTVSLQPILAAAGTRRVIKIFNVRAGNEMGALYGHGGTICALAFSPVHPHILASASTDHTVRIWNTNLALKYSQTRPAVTGEIGSTPSWDNPPGQLITILAGVGGHSAPVCSIAWHPVHPLLASGGMDNEVKIWNVSKLPGFPVDSPLGNSGTLQPSQNPDPPAFQPAHITHLPIFSSRHVHCHWIDQILWPSPSSQMIISKSVIIGKESLHPFAEYASSQNLKPANEICVWQATVLEDMFLTKGKTKVNEDDASEDEGDSEDDAWEDEVDAVVGGLDFEVFSSFQVPRPGLSEEEESVEWGLGMCLSRIRNPDNQKLDLALLLGNHPNGVAEIPFSTLQSCQHPVPIIIHPAETTPHAPVTPKSTVNEDQSQSNSPAFRALDATEIVARNGHLSVSFLFLLRVGQNGLIQLWKQKQKLIIDHNRG